MTPRVPPLPAAVLADPGRVGAPPLTGTITVSAYDPAWPARFEQHRTTILGTLGARALAVEHVGSTAVPGLPAKDRVDIDLIIADPADEDAYVPALTAAGYTLRTRDPDWYEHRCLWNDGHTVNVHVFGPDCDEHLRHLIFRDRLRTHPADRDRYAAAKIRSAESNPHDMPAYVHQKSAVIIDILRRAGLTEG